MFGAMTSREYFYNNKIVAPLSPNHDSAILFDHAIIENLGADCQLRIDLPLLIRLFLLVRMVCRQRYSFSLTRYDGESLSSQIVSGLPYPSSPRAGRFSQIAQDTMP